MVPADYEASARRYQTVEVAEPDDVVPFERAEQVLGVTNLLPLLFRRYLVAGILPDGRRGILASSLADEVEFRNTAGRVRKLGRWIEMYLLNFS